MKQQQKSVKLMVRSHSHWQENNDRLTELPDGSISTIISLLPLKEAIRTSVLSTSWKSAWTNHPDMLFGGTNIIGSSNMSTCISEMERQAHRDLFVKRVDHVMDQRLKGPKMDSIAIRFPLDQNKAVKIDGWISRAVAKGVEKIDLDFSEGRSAKVNNASSAAPKKYRFPCWLLASFGKACRVEHLKLTSCNLKLTSYGHGSLSNSNCLSSLVTVDLRSVDITDEQLEGFLSSCLFLERMVLDTCDNVINFKITSQRSRLKILTIQNCSKIESIEICAENLKMFEYSGEYVRFSFKNVPKLAQVFLCFSGANRQHGVTYALSRMVYDIRQLETLNLISLLPNKALVFPEKVPAFLNLKYMVLSICPFQDDDKLYWASYILKAFPLLNKLQLNLFTPVFTKQSEPEKIDINLPECSHERLRELEINGYYGNRHEFELVKYVVNNAVGLDLLAINPCLKLHRGVNNWSYQDANSCYELSMEKVERLHAVVPRSVCLKML